MTTGNNNTIIGRYNGNQGGLDIRTSSNNIVLSDGDGNPRVYIDASGNVGIGQTSPSNRLEVVGSSDGTIAAFGNGQDNAYLMLQAATNFGSNNSIDNKWSLRWRGRPNAGGHSLAFYDEENTIERMRIDSSGNLLVGTTSASSPFDGCRIAIDANSSDGIRVRSSGVPMRFIATGTSTFVGSISTTASATSYNTSSDYRLKENVTADWDATTRLKQLNPVRFNFISDADTTVDGFLAHEVQDIVPEAISGTKDGMRDEEYEVTPAVLDEDGNEVTPAVMGTRSVPDYQGIDQSKLVPLLVKTIQELEARIAALESN
jgi:ABC-type transport system substrate-binding protein